jgi:hypothetical protein
VKPWTRIGPLGPFRGRLGIAWVVAPLVVGAVLIGAVWLLVLRNPAPGGSFEPVARAASFPEGRARPVDLPGVYVGRTGGALFAVLQEDGCGLQVCSTHYVDCRGVSYGLDGEATNGPGALSLLPLRVYRGMVYVDPDHPVVRSPAPARPSRSSGCA